MVDSETTAAAWLGMIFRIIGNYSRAARLLLLWAHQENGDGVAAKEEFRAWSRPLLELFRPVRRTAPKRFATTGGKLGFIPEGTDRMSKVAFAEMLRQDILYGLK